ncbi:hypothetical protein OF83DRAFT_203551 [Amylostereum chailletii]|nr:hypothetical protein OF83DRAFT_203551 [Amylostereum chailletii]
MNPAPVDDVEKVAPVREAKESFNLEGTYYQSQIEPRRGFAFFAPLPEVYAQAVHKDAETVEYTEAEEKAVRRKIDFRVLPLIVCA